MTDGSQGNRSTWGQEIEVEIDLTLEKLMDKAELVF